MAVTLTPLEKAHLKARAHALEPVVRVGQAGVTARLVAEVERALTAHELIKVRIDDGDRDRRAAAATEICVSTDAALVHRVGKIAILWRPRPVDEE